MFLRFKFKPDLFSVVHNLMAYHGGDVDITSLPFDKNNSQRRLVNFHIHF